MSIGPDSTPGRRVADRAVLGFPVPPLVVGLLVGVLGAVTAATLLRDAPDTGSERDVPAEAAVPTCGTACDDGPAWVRQLGSAGPTDEYATAVASSEDGAVAVVGMTHGSVTGAADADRGGEDAFVARYDSAGDRLWVRQLGSSTNERAFDVAIDEAGAVYVVGYTQGVLPGAPQPHAGREDAFVAKFDAAGTPLWAAQLGTDASEAAHGVAVDGDGGVFVTGSTDGRPPGSTEPDTSLQDIFVARFTASGDRLWLRQLLAPSGGGLGIAIDGTGGVYVGGQSTGWPLGSPELGGTSSDVFVMRLGPDGEQLWAHQLVTAEADYASGVVADPEGGVLVTGHTFGTMPGSSGPNAGASDAFVARYDLDGNRSWVRQFGTTDRDEGNGVAVEDGGVVYVAGTTLGRMPGAPANNGDVDGFLATFDADGNPSSMHQLGTAGRDGANGIALDGGSGVYVAGFTNGALPGSRDPHGGGADAFVAKYVFVGPEAAAR